jgi:RNA polymerase sigma-70 factor (ECF subfamily)
VFNEFYRSYRPRLLRFVYSAGHSDGLSEAHLDAEGVVQETFEAAFKKWATIDHPERWIYTVAARKVRAHSRSEWFQDRQLRQRLGTVRSAKMSDIDPVHTHAVADSIVDRIMELPTNQRIATYLSIVEQWKAAEIAELLGITTTTIHVHVHRGKEKVRDSQYAHQRPSAEDRPRLLSGASRHLPYDLSSPSRYDPSDSWDPPARYRRVGRNSSSPLIATLRRLVSWLIIGMIVQVCWVHPKLALGLGGLAAGIFVV